jgi:beta-lactamase superfamily II metal-dependent hydrolase
VAEESLTELEKLFTSARPAAASSKVAAPAALTKPKALSVLDPNRAREVAIAMITIKEMDLQQFFDAVHSPDDSKLDIDQITSIAKHCVPVRPELKQIRQEGQADKLSKQDKFILALAGVPKIKERLEAWACLRRFDPELNAISPPLESIVAFFDDLATSKPFQEFLKRILAIGNIMNGGNRFKGAAFGFSLASILKLSDTVGANGCSLLLFIVIKMQKESPDNFKALMATLQVAAELSRVSATSLKDELKRLSKQVNAAKKTLAAVQRDTPEADDANDPFIERLTEFCARAEADITDVQGSFDRVETAFAACCKVYAENSKLEDFIAMFASISRMFRVTPLIPASFASISRMFHVTPLIPASFHVSQPRLRNHPTHLTDVPCYAPNSSILCEHLTDVPCYAPNSSILSREPTEATEPSDSSQAAGYGVSYVSLSSPLISAFFIFSVGDYAAVVDTGCKLLSPSELSSLFDGPLAEVSHIDLITTHKHDDHTANCDCLLGVLGSDSELTTFFKSKPFKAASRKLRKHQQANLVEDYRKLRADLKERDVTYSDIGPSFYSSISQTSQKTFTIQGASSTFERITYVQLPDGYSAWERTVSSKTHTFTHRMFVPPQPRSTRRRSRGDHNPHCVMHEFSVPGAASPAPPSFRVLFTGDIPLKQFSAFSGLLKPCNVCVLPHHGSNTSCTPPFFRTVPADTYLVPSGKSGPYDFAKHYPIHKNLLTAPDLTSVQGEGAYAHVSYISLSSPLISAFFIHSFGSYAAVVDTGRKLLSASELTSLFDGLLAMALLIDIITTHEHPDHTANRDLLLALLGPVTELVTFLGSESLKEALHEQGREPLNDREKAEYKELHAELKNRNITYSDIGPSFYSSIKETSSVSSVPVHRPDGELGDPASFTKLGGWKHNRPRGYYSVWERTIKTHNVTHRMFVPPQDAKGPNLRSVMHEFSVPNAPSLPFRVLFTGDIFIGLFLAFSNFLKPCDVCVVPHHGSNTSCTPPFFRTVPADTYLVPSGNHNFPDEGIKPFVEKYPRLPKFARDAMNKRKNSGNLAGFTTNDVNLVFFNVPSDMKPEEDLATDTNQATLHVRRYPTQPTVDGHPSRLYRIRFPQPSQPSGTFPLQVESCLLSSFQKSA